MSGVFDINGNKMVTDSGSIMKDVNTLFTESMRRITTLESMHNEFLLPTLKLYGDTSTMTKEKAANLKAVYDDGVRHFECIANTKWQGEATINYDKKNYNIKLQDAKKNKYKVSFRDWFPTHKYHIKANYSEPSLVRNSVGSKLGRKSYPYLYPNNARGVIDSFPFILYINDVWWGCYTWNITQEGSLFAMNEDNKDHMVFRSNGISGTAGWDVSVFEDRLRDESTEYSMQCLTRMVNWTKTCTVAEFKTDAKDYFDVDSLLYYWVYCDLACGTDSVNNNTTWASWDGQHWYAMWYDTDLIFGMSSGTPFSPTLDLIQMMKSSQYSYKYNPIWDKLYQSYFDELCEAYSDIRERLFPSASAIVKYFTDYRALWGDENLTLEETKWPPRVPAKAIDLCTDDIAARISYCDNKYGYTPNS